VRTEPRNRQALDPPGRAPAAGRAGCASGGDDLERATWTSCPSRRPTGPNDTNRRVPHALNEQRTRTDAYEPARKDPSGKRDDYYRDRRRRKVCTFCADKTVMIDYKEVNRLRRYLSSAPRSSRDARRHLRRPSAPARLALKRARIVACCVRPLHVRP